MIDEHVLREICTARITFCISQHRTLTTPIPISLIAVSTTTEPFFLQSYGEVWRNSVISFATNSTKPEVWFRDITDFNYYLGSQLDQGPSVFYFGTQTVSRPLFFAFRVFIFKC